MKRRTRKQWYQYHLRKAQDAARENVRSFYEPQVTDANAGYDQVWQKLTEARRIEPWSSRFWSWFGIDTDYRLRSIRPLEEDLGEAHSRVIESRSLLSRELQEASKRGEADYLRAREARRVEAEAREQRVAVRRREQRISYLERSPALRSAARFLKRILLREAGSEASQVACFYCQVLIPSQDSHLEHKRPISRGGDNRRANLTLSCAACNLKKGRKTHEEFLRELQNR